MNDDEKIQIAQQIIDNYNKRLDAFAEGAKLVFTEQLKHAQDKDIEAFWQKNFKDTIFPGKEHILSSEYMANFFKSCNKINTEIKNAEQASQIIASLNANHFLFMLQDYQKAIAKKIGLGIKAKDIQKAEAYWVFKQVERQEWRLMSPELIKIEKPKYVPLTEQQKDTLKIDESPSWFKKLKPWEQSFLQDIIKDSSYEFKSIPVTLRHIPGLANSSELFFNYQGVVCKNYRIATPVPYDMPKSEKRAHTQHNFEQLKHGFAEEIKEFDSIFESNYEKYGRPLTVIGLVTPSEQGNWQQKLIDFSGLSGNDNNTEFHKLCLEASSKEDSACDYINFALNERRLQQALAIPELFIKQMKNRLQRLRDITSDEIIAANLQVLEKLIALMADYNNRIETHASSRNPNIYAAACMDLASRLSCGISISFCKSGKDRNGIKFIYADAILKAMIDAPENNVQFDFTDAGHSEFQNTVDAYAIEFYKSGQHQKNADDNSPGGNGLKDEGFYEQGLKDKIAPYYEISKNCANFNKPELKLQKLWKVFSRQVLPIVLAAVMAIIVSISIFFVSTNPISIGLILASTLLLGLGLELGLIKLGDDYFAQKLKSAESVIQSFNKPDSPDSNLATIEDNNNNPSPAQPVPTESAPIVSCPNSPDIRGPRF